jgi:hypothetical protein
MSDYFINNLAQLGIKLDGVVAMDSRNQVRTLAEVGLILIAPLNPFVKSVTRFHAVCAQSPVGSPSPDNASHHRRCGR